jgi:HPt (histidine-containing phosphotransfer) domain-containing protein
LEQFCGASVPEQTGGTTQQLADAAVDWQQVQRYVTNDPRLLAETCVAFLEEVPRKLAEMRQALSDGDAPLLLRAARALRGSAALFTSASICRLAGELESKARRADWAGADEILNTLATELERLRAGIEGHLTELAVAETAERRPGDFPEKTAEKPV